MRIPYFASILAAARLIIADLYATPKYSSKFYLINSEDIENIKKAIKSETKRVFIETPTNPMINVFDISGLAEISKSNNLLFVVDRNGYISCLEAKTGKIFWQERMKGSFSASPIYTNGLIYFFNEDTVCTIIKPARKLEIVATNKVADEQLFYLTSRGLTEEQATGMIVNGFIEPVTRTLPMEYAVEWSSLIELQMEGSVG